jgi:hypothetical protein
MSFRKERKFRLSKYDSLKLKSELLQRNMKQLYPERVIFSQYFDTYDLLSFFNSHEGVLPRKKIRVRWYNDEITGLKMETKISSIEGRFKSAQKINKFTFEKMIKEGYFDKSYGKMIPSVKISYIRSYFKLDKIRVTFDRSIKYLLSSDQFKFRDFEEVVEIKSTFECSDDYLNTLIQSPTSRFSKYERAFLMMNKQI